MNWYASGTYCGALAISRMYVECRAREHGHIYIDFHVDSQDFGAPDRIFARHGLRFEDLLVLDMSDGEIITAPIQENAGEKYAYFDGRRDIFENKSGGAKIFYRSF